MECKLAHAFRFFFGTSLHRNYMECKLRLGEEERQRQDSVA